MINRFEVAPPCAVDQMTKKRGFWDENNFNHWSSWRTSQR